MSKVHDDWLRQFGLDPDDYLITPDAGTPAPRGADVQALEDKIAAALGELDAQAHRLEAGGIDPRFLEMQITEFRTQYAALTKPGQSPTAKRLESFEKTVLAALSEAGHDAVGQLASATKGSSKATHDLRDGAADQIGKLAEGDPKTAFLSRLQALDRDLASADKLTDPAKQKTALAATDQTARALLKEANDAVTAAAATPKDKAAANMALQQIYRGALQDKFGIVVDDPAKTTKTTHLEKAYAALDKVPVDNVVHDKLTNLAFNKHAGASGLYQGKMIIIGQFGKESGDWPYLEPEPDSHPDTKGKTIEAERMSAVVLHELGHSVDTRWGVMKHPERPGCGAWGGSSAQGLAPVLAAQLIAKDATALAPSKTAIEEAVLNVLTSSSIAVPADLASNPKLNGMVESFLTKCRGLRADKNPWDHPWPIGDRCHHESYDGSWVSYSHSARTGGLAVSNYQWRAPGEWFAELYAFTHVQQRKAPTKVDPEVAAYMFQAP